MDLEGITMSFITTVSGRHFDPIMPEEDLIDERDIAHALSLMCRANGHTRIFYSVAQHSIACAKEAVARKESDAVVLGCLLHDASEAYLCDITRPMKQYLSEYLEAEKRLQEAIWQKWMETAPDEQQRQIIFEIDDLMMSKEFHELMAEDLYEDYTKLVRSFSCEYRPPSDIETEFLELLHIYMKATNTI